MRLFTPEFENGVQFSLCAVSKPELNPFKRLANVIAYKHIHREAEKRNQFSFVRIFFNTWEILVNNFFTYIRPKESRSISYNYAFNFDMR